MCSEVMAYICVVAKSQSERHISGGPSALWAGIASLKSPGPLFIKGVAWAL